MGWVDYYRLLVKYNGRISKATRKEREQAARANPNTPPAALSLAKKKYREKQEGSK